MLKDSPPQPEFVAVVERICADAHAEIRAMAAQALRDLDANCRAHIAFIGRSAGQRRRYRLARQLRERSTRK